MNKNILPLFFIIMIVGINSAFSQKKVLTYLHPVPGSKYHNLNTKIIVKPDFSPGKKLMQDKDLISVNASKSGKHTGNTVISTDGKTIIFIPENSFYLSDTVFVKISGKLTNNHKDFSYFFTTKSKDASNFDNYNTETGLTTGFPKINSQNTANNQDGLLPLIFPTITILNSTNPSPGYLFISSWRYGNYDPYLIIFDNSGNVIFSRKMANNCTDFKMHPNRTFTYYEYDKKKYYLLNQAYVITDSFYCSNNLETDPHEILLRNDGSSFLIGLDPQIVDMSVIVPGGSENATVIGNTIQQLDLNKNLIFEWRSWDHFEITDAVHINFLSNNIDYVHCNAIEIDKDNNILISSRHLNEITKIDYSSGEIIWRFGGKNNQFEVINDTVSFSYQHDIRRLPNDNITIFDNGNYHPAGIPSRVLEYKLDEENKQAFLQWSYTGQGIYSQAMGNAQRLENGNTIIGWGNTSPTLTEVNNSGVKVFEMKLPNNVQNYRAYRFNMTLTNIHNDETPVSYELKQNFPNPFNPTTEIEFSITKPGVVNLEVFNIAGKKVAAIVNKYHKVGNYSYTFDGKYLSSGVYFYRITTKEFTDTRKMILVK